jgi:hypothetical protein
MLLSPLPGPETRVKSGVWRDFRMLDLLLIYSRDRGFSTHGREMYLGPFVRGEGNWMR